MWKCLLLYAWSGFGSRVCFYSLIEYFNTRNSDLQLCGRKKNLYKLKATVINIEMTQKCIHYEFSITYLHTHINHLQYKHPWSTNRPKRTKNLQSLTCAISAAVSQHLIGNAALQTLTRCAWKPCIVIWLPYTERKRKKERKKEKKKLESHSFRLN